MLLVMCGLSFAGKSTLARQLRAALPADLISLDDINAERGLDGGQGIPLEAWAETNRIAHTRAADALRGGRNVVVDDTGSPRFIREQWREVAAAAHGTFAIVWVQIDPARQRSRVNVNRSANRRLDVTDQVLEAHTAHFEEPVDENPITIDADDTADARRVHDVVKQPRELGDRHR